jgi:hypothetical protein
MRPIVDIDTMLSHYIIAALWSSTDESREDGGDPMDENYGPDDIAPETRENMRAECAAFVARISDADLTEYRETYDEEQLGHDYWLTRNHHGVGFWDRDLGDLGDRLTDLAHTDGESTLYLGDDGLIYEM